MSYGGRAQPKYAIALENLLNAIMVNQPGSLDGFVAARQDLVRLADVTVYLRMDMVASRASGDPSDARSSDATAGRIRRRLPKALIAYGRTSLRTKESWGQLIIPAREGPR